LWNRERAKATREKAGGESEAAYGDGDEADGDEREENGMAAGVYPEAFRRGVGRAGGDAPIRQSGNFDDSAYLNSFRIKWRRQGQCGL